MLITLSKNPYTRVPNKSVQMGSSINSANYKWICGAGSCFVERPTDPEGSTERIYNLENVNMRNEPPNTQTIPTNTSQNNT